MISKMTTKFAEFLPADKHHDLTTDLLAIACTDGGSDELIHLLANLSVEALARRRREADSISTPITVTGGTLTGRISQDHPFNRELDPDRDPNSDQIYGDEL